MVHGLSRLTRVSAGSRFCPAGEQKGSEMVFVSIFISIRINPLLSGGMSSYAILHDSLSLATTSRHTAISSSHLGVTTQHHTLCNQSLKNERAEENTHAHTHTLTNMVVQSPTSVKKSLLLTRMIQHIPLDRFAVWVNPISPHDPLSPSPEFWEFMRRGTDMWFLFGALGQSVRAIQPSEVRFSCGHVQIELHELLHSQK